MILYRIASHRLGAVWCNPLERPELVQYCTVNTLASFNGKGTFEEQCRKSSDIIGAHPRRSQKKTQDRVSRYVMQQRKEPSSSENQKKATALKCRLPVSRLSYLPALQIRI